METTVLNFTSSTVAKTAPTAPLEYTALRHWEPYGVGVRVLEGDGLGKLDELEGYAEYRTILTHTPSTYTMERVSDFGTSAQDYKQIYALLAKLHRVPPINYYIPFKTNLDLRLHWFKEDNPPEHHQYGQDAYNYLLKANNALPQVTCHGDFQSKNIYRENSNLKVIDPIPTLGNNYFDFAMWLATTENSKLIIANSAHYGYNTAILASTVSAIRVLNHNPNRGR